MRVFHSSFTGRPRLRFVTILYVCTVV
ncbi:hypothetical protein 2.16 [Burkholderia phage Bups phi1]|nr:hypothetical protein 2.16 [Burkholderia phage Bups phi1]